MLEENSKEIIMEQLEIGKKYYKNISQNGEILNKWLVLEQITKFDVNLNVIYINNGSGEWFNKYDDKGNIIYANQPNGDNGKSLEVWYEYDSNENLIHQKNSAGGEKYWKCTLEEDILKKHYRSNYSISMDKKEEDMILWYSNKNLIYRKDNLLNTECWFEYDKNGNRMKQNDSNGNEAIGYLEYDENNNLTRVNVEGNSEESKLYLKSKWDYDGWTLYDGQEIYFEYDKNNRLRHYRKGDDEFWYIYEKAENEIIQYKFSRN